MDTKTSLHNPECLTTRELCDHSALRVSVFGFEVCSINSRAEIVVNMKTLKYIDHQYDVDPDVDQARTMTVVFLLHFNVTLRAFFCN